MRPYLHKGNTMTMNKISVPAGAWEELRKEARKLEGEVDMKLAAYSKFAGSPGSTNSEAMRLGEGDANAKAAEIESLLQRLSDVNEAMSGAVTGGDARSHTLARHRDIAMEFTQEFRRIRNTITQGREHAALLGGGGAGSSQFAMGGGSSSANAQLLRERNSIHNSSSAVEDVIGQAQATAAALVSQRGMFNDISSKLVQAGSRFPVINNMITAIKRKKSKDTIILSAVVAICTAFMLIYWLSK